MAKKKKRSGHYCWVCGRILPNERFSGKGHSQHICRDCQKMPEEKLREIKVLDRLYHFGKSTTPDQLDQTWVNCLNPFGVEYNA